MKVGVALFTVLREVGRAGADVAREAEELGYDSLWLGEHIVVPAAIGSSHPGGRSEFDPTQPWPEALVSLGFIASATERVRLGTSVVPVLTRDPLSLAKQAATVDVLSGGRLELGLGAGWLVEEARALGHPVDHPNGRLAETIHILRRAWSEPEFEHRGRFYEFDAVGVHPQPPQGRDLPIWIGGASPRVLRMTAELGAGNVISPHRLELLPAIKAGLPAGTPVSGVIRLSDDRDADAARTLELRDQGLDRLILTARGTPALREGIRWFADELLAEAA